MKLEKISWGLFIQICMFIVLILGIIHADWTLSILIWLGRKIRNTVQKTEAVYLENIDDFIDKLEQTKKQTVNSANFFIKISSLIFISLISGALIFLIIGQNILAAICILLIALGPFILAQALSFVSLNIIAAPIAGIAIWFLLIALNFIVWPINTFGSGLRISILIFLMLISSAFIAYGKKRSSFTLIVAITLSFFMMIYSSSSWVRALAHRTGSSLAVSTALSERSAESNQRKAQAIREFSQGIVIEQGVLRKENKPEITIPAKLNTKLLIEYFHGMPVRPRLDSAISLQFKGSFVKIYLQDKNGSFPKQTESWFIEDIKVKDQENHFFQKTQNPKNPLVNQGRGNQDGVRPLNKILGVYGQTWWVRPPSQHIGPYKILVPKNSRGEICYDPINSGEFVDVFFKESEHPPGKWDWHFISMPDEKGVSRIIKTFELNENENPAQPNLKALVLASSRLYSRHQAFECFIKKYNIQQ